MERVRILGFDVVYLVTRLDHVTRVADLLPLIYGKRRRKFVSAAEATPRRREAITA
jgi:hypothetical protein